MQIQMVGDEALERKDGGILRILYTGENTRDFMVTGRVKGSKQGFIETGWRSVNWQQPEDNWLLGYILASPVFGVTGSISLYFLLSIERSPEDGYSFC